MEHLTIITTEVGVAEVATKAIITTIKVPIRITEVEGAVVVIKDIHIKITVNRTMHQITITEEEEAVGAIKVVGVTKVSTKKAVVGTKAINQINLSKKLNPHTLTEVGEAVGATKVTINKIKIRKHPIPITEVEAVEVTKGRINKIKIMLHQIKITEAEEGKGTFHTTTINMTKVKHLTMTPEVEEVNSVVHTVVATNRTITTRYLSRSTLTNLALIISNANSCIRVAANKSIVILKKK